MIHSRLPSPKEKGFTLIELLIVIAILGSLAALFMFTYPSAQRRARDSQRKSDIKQYQTALEVYANSENGLYPKRTAAAGQPNTVLCSDIGLTTCPNDPQNSQSTCGGNLCRYRYQTSSCGLSAGQPCATQFVLWAALESPDASGNDVYFVACSNGNSGEVVSGSIPPSGGNCPI